MVHKTGYVYKKTILINILWLVIIIFFTWNISNYYWKVFIGSYSLFIFLIGCIKYQLEIYKKCLLYKLTLFNKTIYKSELKKDDIQMILFTTERQSRAIKIYKKSIFSISSIRLIDFKLITIYDDVLKFCIYNQIPFTQTKEFSFFHFIHQENYQGR